MAKPLTREELEELARRLPYQRVRDSPTHPYYTNWKAFQLVEAGELAREAAEPPFTAKAQPTALLYPAGVRVEAPPRGVYVEPLSPEALGEWRVPVEGRLDALHALRWASGLRVWATGGSRGRVVVWLLGGRSGYAGYHVEVTVEPDAELELVLVAYTSPGSAMTATTLSSVGERATLRLASVNLGGGAVYFRRVAAVGEDARVESRIAALGGDMVHDREDNFIVGARGSATVAASLSSAGGQRLDAVENVILRAPSTAGRVTARGIVNGQSYLVSRGVARVERQASEGSAAYESTVLVMDEGGKGYSVPVLEVDTGMVVEARHSTAVYAPPAEEVFYLRQRGLSLREVRYLLTLATLSYSGALEAAGISAEEAAEAILAAHAGEAAARALAGR